MMSWTKVKDCLNQCSRDELLCDDEYVVKDTDCGIIHESNWHKKVE